MVFFEIGALLAFAGVDSTTIGLSALS